MATRSRRREYESTHPFLNFRLDLDRASHDMWALLGEARSKIQHLAGTPLKPSEAAEFYRMYLVKGALATTAIEGNTLSEAEGLALLDGTLEIPPSREYLAQEVRNVIDGCNQVADELIAGRVERTVSLADVKRFNALVLRGLEVSPEVVPGELRTHSVAVGGRYRGAPAADCEYLIQRLCEFLEQDFDPPNEAWRMPYALLKAIVAHVYLVLIHPFGDGNGRTARLIELRTLLAAGVPKPATQLLSNHYNLTRSDYTRQLDALGRGGPLHEFIRYAMQGFVDGLAEQLALVRDAQWADRWEQYVYETLGGAAGPSAERRRLVALQLPFPEPTALGAIRRLSPELADRYAGKTKKTVSRDVNELERLGLIQRVGRGLIRPNRDIIKAFLPTRIEPEIAIGGS